MSAPTNRDRIPGEWRIWAARVVWILLPVLAGNALADALEPWSRAPGALAAGLAWLSWLGGLVALLAPRPWGFTTLRIVGPGLSAAALATVWSTSAPSAALAVGATVVATVMSLSAPVAATAADAVAYGEERRYALRAPLVIVIAPLPLAVAGIVLGVCAGPLALADQRWVVGAVAAAIGLPLAALLVRAVHQLDRRWLVMVPAGIVVVDPLTLVDPVLLPRDRVGTVTIGTTESADELAGLLDLRLGALAGSMRLALLETGTFVRRTGRTGATTVEAVAVAVTPLLPRHVIPQSRAHLQRRAGATR